MTKDEEDVVSSFRRALETAVNGVMDVRLKYLLGCKIKFPPNNQILFGQDMTVWEGVPSDVEFEIVDISSGGKIRMSAPGYGGKPYGNGCIFVWKLKEPRP